MLNSEKLKGWYMNKDDKDEMAELKNNFFLILEFVEDKNTISKEFDAFLERRKIEQKQYIDYLQMFDRLN